MPYLADLGRRLASAIQAPAFLDGDRMSRVIRSATPALHVLVVSSAAVAVVSLALALVAVEWMAKGVSEARRAVAITEVPLPAVVRRMPEPARIATVKALLAAAYPDVTVKDAGAELKLSVSSAEKISAFRAASQRLQVLDPAIRWEVVQLCAGGGQHCPQVAQLTVTGAVIEFVTQAQKTEKAR